MTGGDYGQPTTVIATTSPFVFTAPANGTLLVSGGGISLMQQQRGSSGYFSTGSYYGAFPMALGDMMRIVYVSVPKLEFSPG